jgi:hypothetical protein
VDEPEEKAVEYGQNVLMRFIADNGICVQL